MPLPDDIFPPPLPKKRRGKRRAPLPAHAPLSAHKMMELLAYLGWPSDPDFAVSIGSKSHDEVWKWHRGLQIPSHKDKMVIAHVYDVPERWWEQEGVPIGDVIGRGMGRDEGRARLGQQELQEIFVLSRALRDNLARLERLSASAQRHLQQPSKGAVKHEKEGEGDGGGKDQADPGR
jgi:hypothetical protein